MKKGKIIVHLEWDPFKYPFEFDDLDSAVKFMDMAFEHEVPNGAIEKLRISMEKVLEDGNPNTAPEK